MSKTSEGLEIENKFLTDQSTLEELINFYSSPDIGLFVQMVERDERVNTYCDTKKKFHLYQRGMEFRTRDKGTEKTKTDLKTPRDLNKPEIGPNDDGLMYRGEFSAVQTNLNPKLSLACFNDSSAAPFIADIQDKTLKEWVKGSFKRWKVTFAPAANLDSTIEMALERGKFFSPDSTYESEEFFFIEFESKDGNVPALLQAIEKFKEIRGSALTLSTRTKGEMGLEWLAQAGGIPVDLVNNFRAAQDTRAKYYTKLRKDEDHAKNGGQMQLNLTVI